MSNAKYLVSGGAGALGKLIISMLVAKGEKVKILMSELSDVSDFEGNPNIEICYGISTDKDSMNEFFDIDDPRHAVLIHADEYISLSDSTNLTMRRVNVIGAENIVDMCLKRKIGRLVYLSSAYALNPDLIGKDTLELHFDRNKVEGEYAKSKAETAAYIMEKVAPEGEVYQAGTLSGNPLAMAAGCATLKTLNEDPALYETLEQKTKLFIL